MNFKNILNMKKRTVLLCAIIGFLAHVPAFSQKHTTTSGTYNSIYNSIYSNSIDGGRYNRYLKNNYEYDEDYGSYGNYVSESSYKKYFYNDTPKDSNHAKFSMVTESYYRAYDSMMTNKKMMTKTVKMYNKKGLEVFEMDIDSNGKVKDSVRTGYDSKFRICRESTYSRDDSGLIYLSNFKFYKYDAKNNMVMDSSYRVYGHHDDPPTMERTLYTYNDSGSELSHKRFSVSGENGEDTTSEYGHSVYDKDNNLIFSETINDYDTNREYYSYNNKGKEIFRANIRLGGDSNYVKKKYNSKGDMVSYERYDAGKLAEVLTDSTDAKGDIIETEEKLSTADALSCPNNTVTVTVTDTSGHLLSYVETKEKDGNQLVTTTIHKYVLDKNRIVRDTVSEIEEGFMYSELKQEVKVNKFDNAGNMTEQSSEGGGQYSSDYRYTWEYNDKSSLLNESRYNSCSTDKLSYRTINTYYKDGVSIKSTDEVNAYGRHSITMYNENSRIEQDFSTSGDYSSAYTSTSSKRKAELASEKKYFQTIYEYKK
jgi:hypothetical protein